MVLLGWFYLLLQKVLYCNALQQNSISIEKLDDLEELVWKSFLILKGVNGKKLRNYELFHKKKLTYWKALHWSPQILDVRIHNIINLQLIL